MIIAKLTGVSGQVRTDCMQHGNKTLDLVSSSRQVC